MATIHISRARLSSLLSFFRLLAILVLPVYGKAQTSTICDVKLAEQYRTKDVLELVTGQMNVTRYLTDEGFQISSAGSELKSQLEAKFSELNIPYTSISQHKESVVLRELKKLVAWIASLHSFCVPIRHNLQTALVPVFRS